MLVAVAALVPPMNVRPPIPTPATLDPEGPTTNVPVLVDVEATFDNKFKVLLLIEPPLNVARSGFPLPSKMRYLSARSVAFGKTVSIPTSVIGITRARVLRLATC